MYIESLPISVNLGVAQAEYVECCAGLLLFPEFGAEGVNFTDYLGVADGNFVRCDANRCAVFLVQSLDVVPSGANNIVPFQGKAGDLGMPWSWHMAKRRQVRAPKSLISS